MSGRRGITSQNQNSSILFRGFSTRWPGHVPSPQDMEVKVKHRLAAVSAGIRHDSVAGLTQAFLFRYLRACDEQLSQKSLILSNAILHVHHMLLRNDQCMCRCLRIDVVEGECLVVFINDFSGNFFLNNFTKQTIAHGSRLTFSASGRTSRIVYPALHRSPGEGCRDNPRPSTYERRGRPLHRQSPPSFRPWPR